MNSISKHFEGEDERAVSPVIGVILMVAITVILAAVIAAFVLDIGDTSANPQAGFDINQDGDNVSSVTIQTINRLDEVRIEGTGCSARTNENGAIITPWGTQDGADTAKVNDNPSVGDTIEFGTQEGDVSTPFDDFTPSTGSDVPCDRDDLQIIGVYDGNEVVMI